MTVAKINSSTDKLSARDRIRQWIKTLYRDPTAEERAMQTRRERLLEELNRAVAEAPDDVPIKSIIERLNQHRDD